MSTPWSGWSEGCSPTPSTSTAPTPPRNWIASMTSRHGTPAGVGAREMNLYRRYFDMVATGRKTIEVRVQYPNLRNLRAGDHIRFVCGRDDALTRVRRVARYTSFEEMLDAEGPDRVNPDSPRDQQLANIRRIYGPEKEALGVLAIEIELLDPPPDD